MRRRRRRGSAVRSPTAAEDAGASAVEAIKDEQRAVLNVQTLLKRFWKVAAPYWSSEDKVQARLRLAAVFALTSGTTGISVGFNFLGRDFYNSLANKDQVQFMKQLLYYLGAFAGGIPAHLYSQIEAAGIAYVSIGHRSTLYKYHNKVLHLSKFNSEKPAQQNWHFEPINQKTTPEQATPTI